MTFDFYNLLTPTEFENLCRDVLEIRENPLTFRTFNEGRDGGIDIKCTNSSHLIIGQCKHYDPSNFNSLFSSLKTELENCVRLKPDRYIICVSKKLNVAQVDKVRSLFKAYIHSDEDIIDGVKLNQYLSSLKYKDILKTYSKLLAPNQLIHDQLLEKIINKKYHRQTKSSLNEIKKKQLLFHQTKHIKPCIDLVEKNRVLIITGNPGVGKTTVSQIISHYLIHYHNIKSFYFLSDKSMDEVESLLDDDIKQLIVIDDFWGQNFSPLYKKNTLLNNFVRIIEDVKNSPNIFLILTSRQYIIQDVINSANEQIKWVLNNELFTISIDDYSPEDKARIFLNHLRFYDYNKIYFQMLSWKSSKLESIVHNRNYSPRHIEFFLKQHTNKYSFHPIDFFDDFLDYLRKPTTFWNKNFHDLNDTAQIILITLLTCDDPIEIQDLEKAFREIALDANVQEEYEAKPRYFFDELKLLEDFYILQSFKFLFKKLENVEYSKVKFL